MKSSILILIISLFTIHLFAQNNISGKVLDAKSRQPIAFANVFWLQTTAGTTTDQTGYFELTISELLENSKLVVSYVGYHSDTITVSAQGNIGPILLKSSVELATVEIEGRTDSKAISLMEPLIVENIGGAELRKAACCNLSESFETNATVDVNLTDAVSGAKRIQMLGLDGIYSQILFENMPYMRGLSAANGLGFVPGTWIESIQVTKGTGSVVTGYESMAGQINLEFLKPEEEGEKIYVNLYGNMMARIEANVHYRQKVSNKVSQMLFIHANRQTSKIDNNKDGFLDMPMRNQINVFNRWKYMGKTYRAQLGVFAVSENLGGGQVAYNTSESAKKSPYFGVDIATQQVGFFAKNGFIFKNHLDRSIGVQVMGKYHNQNSFYGRKSYTGTERYLYANAIYQDRFHKHSYKFGASFIHDDYRQMLNDSAFNRTEIVPGIFGEYAYNANDKFIVIAGLRNDFHNLFGNQLTPRLNLKWNPDNKSALRFSAGRGFRVPNMFVEQASVLSSSRTIVVQSDLKPEVSWSSGLSYQYKGLFVGRTFTFTVDYFKTWFQNQLVADLEAVDYVKFYNVTNSSFSDAAQAELSYEPFDRFTVRTAYKFTHVIINYNEGEKTRPFIPKHRALVNMAYATKYEKWKFDATLNWFGASRIPSTAANTAGNVLPLHSEDYFLLHTQITKKYKKHDAYIGIENLLGFQQRDAIIDAANPFGNQFDASMIWGPLGGRVIYFGIRIIV